LSESGPYLSRIVCRPAERFYEYKKQRLAGSTIHSAADQPPVIDKSCLNGTSKVDDVITASAKVLWFTAQRDQNRTPEKFVEYMATAVFPAS
jgi:hypothetical protein